MSRYNNIHRQQLFHWIGSHLDEKSDGRTVNLAAQQKNIQKHLFRKDAPHVTLLSLQDIGTF